MKQFIETVYKKNLPTTEKGEIKQNDRNALRAETVASLDDFFRANGVETLLTKEGIAVEIPHEELGAVVAMVSVTIKSQQFDALSASQEYLENQAEKAKKEAEKKAKAEAKAK